MEENMRGMWLVGMLAMIGLFCCGDIEDQVGFEIDNEWSQKTADGVTPAEETVCDGLPGREYGLCVAYCEAMDCESAAPHASEQACDSVFNNYLRASGGEEPPCAYDDDDEDPL